MPEDVGAAEEMVRQWQERAAEKAQKFEAMRSRVEQISVSESSRDGAVRVTVGSNGLLQGLELAESAGNRPMPKLAAEIMRTLQLAQSRVPELMQQAVAETVGTEDTAAQHILGQARRNFPEAPAEDDEPTGRGQGIQEVQVGVEDDYEPPQRRSAPPPPGPSQPPQPPQRPAPGQRRGPDDFDDDDFSSGSFLR